MFVWQWHAWWGLVLAPQFLFFFVFPRIRYSGFGRCTNRPMPWRGYCGNTVYSNYCNNVFLATPVFFILLNDKLLVFRSGCQRGTRSKAWYGTEWNGKWNGMERKFRYGIWKMPEWNGRQSSILPYQFHTRFCALYLQKNTYRCRVVIMILSQKYWTSSTHIICRQITVLWLWTLRKQCTYCIIVSKLQFNCSIDVTVDDLDRYDLMFFLFWGWRFVQS